MAGIKKLVPSKISKSIIIADTRSAGNANRANSVATKMPHTVNGSLIIVRPRQRYCKTVTT